MVESGTRCAATANNNSGTSVTGPVDMSSAAWSTPEVNSLRPVTSRNTTNASANGAATIPSAAMPRNASSWITFLTSPYSANEQARPSAITGGRP